MTEIHNAVFEPEKKYGKYTLSHTMGNSSTNNTVLADDQNAVSGSPPEGDTDANDLRCGLGYCRPDCLQMFNNPKAVLVWLGWFAFIQGFMINGINNVNTATLERRFELTSSQAGFISSSYDISAAIFVIPISYYGAHAHQPRMLAIASLVMVCGAFVMTAPHFATGLYELKNSQADQCLGDVQGFNNTTVCDGSGSGLSMWLGVFVLGMILIGIGGTTLYSVGVVFMDSNVCTRSSPLYQGILTCSSTVGSAVGYLLGGYFLETLYVDIDKVEANSNIIEASDPRFVGAWWIGFMFGGILLVPVMFLVMCYPRELPAAKAARLKSVTQVHQSGGNEVASREGFGRKWKDLPAALRVLFRNPVYIFNMVASVCDLMMASGFATFLTKLLRNQFNLPAGKAAMFAGLVSVLGAAVGQIGGALICKFARLNVRGMLRMTIGLSVGVAVSFAAFFMRCSTPHIAGVNVHYGETEITLRNVTLESTCNERCGCTTISYEPICSDNQIQYFSPCHAGCQTIYQNDSVKMFVNCSCISQPAVDTNISMATEGGCDVDCIYLNTFLVILFAAIFMLFLTAVPILTITLRCIPESQRSFGIGIQWVFIRLLGTVPGPVMMGAVFDVTCVAWQETCDGSGSCWIYNGAHLSIRVFIMGLVIKITSALFFTLALRFYKPPPAEGTDKELYLGDNSAEVRYSTTVVTPTDKCVHTGLRNEMEHL